MMRMLSLLLCLAAAVGCATVTRGVEEVFVVESTPAGAKVALVYDAPVVLYVGGYEESEQSGEEENFGASSLKQKTITTQRLEGITPATFKIPRKGAFTVKITKEGYNPVVMRVETQVSEEGGAALAGNICIGGCLGGALDVSSGATLEHVPRAINVTLVEEGYYPEVNPTHEPPSRRGDPVEQKDP